MSAVICRVPGLRDPPPETRAFLVRHRLSHAHFPGAPHWLIEHDPDAFHERLRAFLAAGR